MSVSLDEVDDSADSGSDYEAPTKATKRRKQAVPALLVNNLFPLKRAQSHLDFVIRYSKWS